MAKKQKQSKAKADSVAPSKPTSNVRIERISNGFVVSTYTDTGEKAKYGKTKKESK